VKGIDDSSGLFYGTDLDILVFHEVRHTAASLSIAAGAHPLTINGRLGHSSITVTMNRYVHLLSAQDEALAEALDAGLREGLEWLTEEAIPVLQMLQR
jgi:integrase